MASARHEECLKSRQVSSSSSSTRRASRCIYSRFNECKIQSVRYFVASKYIPTFLISQDVYCIHGNLYVALNETIFITFSYFSSHHMRLGEWNEVEKISEWEKIEYLFMHFSCRVHIYNIWNGMNRSSSSRKCELTHK